jgi:CDP-diacylglycerol--glycerol-3-phosphate 3-phosphatidyltransferase
VAARLAPSTITATGLAFSLLVPVAVAFRGWWLFVAAGLVLLAAIADSVDGAVAVLSTRSTGVGSFYDAMADRLSEASWLLALWLLGVPGWLVTACGGLAWLHEYARARAAVAGMRGVGLITVAERPMRVILVVLALGLGGVAYVLDPRLAAGTATVVVAVWVVLGLLGGGRLYSTIRATLATSTPSPRS